MSTSYAQTKTLQELSDIIAQRTKQISNHLTAQGLPAPSFTAATTAPDFLPPGTDAAIIAARAELVEASRSLHELATGNRRYLVEKTAMPHHQSFAFQAVGEWDLASHVPLEGSIALADLSAASGMPLDPLQRVLRLLASYHVFSEPQPGHVGHTSISRLIATDPRARSWLHHINASMLKAAAFQVEAIKRYPEQQDGYQTGQGVASGWTEGTTIWDILLSDPARSKTFNEAMEFASVTVIGDAKAAMAGYDWSTLPDGGLVVDVGGGYGIMSKSLAAELPQLRFVVQDLPSVMDELPEKTCMDGRVSFAAHSFFEPQPIRDADAYYYRRVFHDWSDKHCRRILDALVPSMKKGSKLFIGDSVVPPAGVLPRAVEEFVSFANVQMMVGLAGKERMLGEWKDLVEGHAGGSLAYKAHGPSLVVFERV